MYIIIAVFNGRQLPTVLSFWVHVAAQGRRGKLFRFPRNPVWCVY